MSTNLPLQGIKVAEIASGVAAAYAGRLMASMGADVIMVEPPGGSPLRQEPPFLGPDSKESALFAYLAAGKRSVICDLVAESGRADCDGLLAGMDILMDDTPVMRRNVVGLDPARIAARHPRLVHLSVLPFGAHGPKAGWKGSELNIIHACGEGFLLPNGLSADLFPERPPLKIAGHFAEMQGGIAAALAGLAALWSGKGQFVDVSAQDAAVAVGAFTVQRYGDGSLEHRASRSFRYGGVIACRDGYVELLTLEERQWYGLVDLLGQPDWATGPALADPAERSARGADLNARIRAWALHQDVDELVARAQKLGVPMARYNTPEQVLAGRHEQARGLFSEIAVPGGGKSRIQTGPFRFGPQPLPVCQWPSEAGADQHLLERGCAVAVEQSRREHA